MPLFGSFGNRFYVAEPAVAALPPTTNISLDCLEKGIKRTFNQLNLLTSNIGIVGKLLNALYTQFQSPGLLKVASRRKMQFGWVVEAGCHDGTDTLKFLELPCVKKVYAFEPDHVAAEKAEEKFTNYGERVDLKRIALMNYPGIIDISSPTGNFGDGTSVVTHAEFNDTKSDGISKVLKCSTMDLEVKNLDGSGLLWLDVEGSAALVLEGAEETLKSILLIQVEVDTHTSQYRKANYSEVDKILRKSGFSMLYGPLHPGYFGDAIYLRNTCLKWHEQLTTRAIRYLYLIVHSIVFPLAESQKSNLVF